MREARLAGRGDRRVAFELGVAEGEEAERRGGAAATVAVVPGGSVRGAWWDLREAAAAEGRVGVEQRGCYEACGKEKPEQLSEERRKLHRDITECESIDVDASRITLGLFGFVCVFTGRVSIVTVALVT